MAGLNSSNISLRSFEKPVLVPQETANILNMAPATTRYSSVIELLLILLVVVPFSQALKFDLVAHSGHSTKNERCIRNFVNRDTLVVVTATISGSRGDGQIVNMHVSCS